MSKDCRIVIAYVSGKKTRITVTAKKTDFINALVRNQYQVNEWQFKHLSDEDIVEAIGDPTLSFTPPKYDDYSYTSSLWTRFEAQQRIEVRAPIRAEEIDEEDDIFD